MRKFYSQTIRTIVATSAYSNHAVLFQQIEVQQRGNITTNNEVSRKIQTQILPESSFFKVFHARQDFFVLKKVRDTSSYLSIVLQLYQITVYAFFDDLIILEPRLTPIRTTSSKFGRSIVEKR